MILSIHEGWLNYPDSMAALLEVLEVATGSHSPRNKAFLFIIYI